MHKLVLAGAALACGPLAAQTAPAKEHNAAYYAFRNTVDQKIPPDPSLPHFQLSHSYPARNPGTCKECTWLQLNVDFTVQFPPQVSPSRWHDGHWDEYLNRILQYVKQGQDPNLKNDVGFRTTVDGKTRWFNVPWMAYDPTAGREFIHGTTNERTAHLSNLINGRNRPVRGVNFLPLMSQGCEAEWPHGFETWAVGFYNEWGGYAVGKAFPATGEPHITSYQGSRMPDGLPFPEGTVVVKVLTTNAPVSCVSYLKNSPEWQIHRHAVDPKTKDYLCRREVQISRVVQVDVAVVDPRSPTRWVYGTFGYDADLPGDTFWDHLLPLGVQWGSDPWTFPAVPQQNGLPPQQTVLNPQINIFEHFGCERRLAGPVDNPQSSCMSCHGSAYAAPGGAVSTMGLNVPPSFGFDGMCVQYSLDNAAYFQNQQPPQHFPGGRFPDAYSLDTSLQLEVAFTQYGYFHTQHAPEACKDPNQF